ncbi:type II toxin-antitoxin system VapB family antitoxin [Nitratireductor thuwali]
MLGRNRENGRYSSLSCPSTSRIRPAVALASELARRQGIRKTAAIHQTMSEHLHRMGFGDTAQERLRADLRAIRERVARLPELDRRSDEEIVGYDEHGIPS